MMNDCPFCNLDRKPLQQTQFMYLIESKYAVADNGHFLIIPKRHIQSCYYLLLYEWLEVKELLDSVDLILKQNGYFDSNVGFNDGEYAGQTVMHAHIHIIGRKKGDVENPRGGIRNVIPIKGDYLKEKQ